MLEDYGPIYREFEERLIGLGRRISKRPLYDLDAEFGGAKYLKRRFKGICHVGSKTRSERETIEIMKDLGLVVDNDEARKFLEDLVGKEIGLSMFSYVKLFKKEGPQGEIFYTMHYHNISIVDELENMAARYSSRTLI